MYDRLSSNNSHRWNFSCQPDTGIKLNFTAIVNFLHKLDCPQEDINCVVHIAGTNGKGSTIAFLEALLASCGMRVGKFISPPLLEANERIQYCNQNITDQELSSVWSNLQELPEFLQLSNFEAWTAAAFVHFARVQPDCLLLETGLGGRLDATNVIKKPSITLITTIGLDHTELLGDTTEKIAFEKAGILKPNVPYATTATGSALRVIRARARELNCPELPIYTNHIDTDRLGLAGEHQQTNARLAITGFMHLAEVLGIPSPEDALEAIYNPINWPGRLMRATLTSGHTLILDGAHNPQGMAALTAHVRKSSDDHSLHWLFGCLNTKAGEEMLAHLLPISNKTIITLPSDEADSWKPESELQNIRNLEYISNFEAAWTEFSAELMSASPSTIGVVAGSLYLVGKVLKKLGRTNPVGQT